MIKQIKYILLAVVAFFATVGHSSSSKVGVSIQETHRMYKELAAKVNVTIPLKIRLKSEINAECFRGSHIVINSYALTKLNIDEVALVLAHEIGHEVHNTTSEKLADVFAYQLITNSKYDICKARNLFIKLHKQNPKHNFFSPHPRSLDRYTSMSSTCKD